MPQDAPPNSGASEDAPEGPYSKVTGIQAKLHRWAAADPGRRFDDPFKLRVRPRDAGGGVRPSRGQQGRESAR